MPPRTRRRSRLHKWQRYLTIAGEAGTIAMSLRDRPTRLDWIGVGLRAVGVALKVHGERQLARASDPWRYFDNPAGEPWVEVPEEFRRTVVTYAEGAVVDEAYWDGDEKSPFLCRARIGDEVVAWIGEGTSILDGPYVRAERVSETYRVLGERMRRRLGGSRLLYNTAGLGLDPFVGDVAVATAQMRALGARMRMFLAAGFARSYLFVGPPGTGKSVAIRWLVDSLSLSSVRIDMTALARLHHGNGAAITTSLETLLQLLRPDVMILDDLDRVRVSAQLLAFLELATRTCRIVLASANCLDHMLGAAIRPGRFDEVITVDRLDPDVLRTLLGADQDLFDRLADLPAAYVSDFLKRRLVLGRDAALAELAELVARSTKIGGAVERDDD
jgi:hypothetical protein